MLYTSISPSLTMSVFFSVVTLTSSLMVSPVFPADDAKEELSISSKQFPLYENVSWTYAAEGAGAQTQRNLSLTVGDKVDLGGRQAYKITVIAPNGDANSFYLSLTDKALTRHRDEFDSEGQKVFSFPLSKGSKWETDNGNGWVDAITTVSTPSGKYKCAKIKIHNASQTDGGGIVLWIAPDVGIVGLRFPNRDGGQSTLWLSKFETAKKRAKKK